MTQKGWLIDKCMACDSDLEPAKNLLGGKNKWFAQCSNPTCGAIHNVGFEPTDGQLDFLAEDNQILGYFGGYGSGKTSSGGFKTFLHSITVPGGMTIVGAAGWAQMLRTNVLELAEIIPPQLLSQKPQVNLSPNGGQFTANLLNGHHIFARVLNDEEALRSLNLTGAWVEEASAVKYSIYNQLKTRMRHEAGINYLFDQDGNPVSETYLDGTGVMRTRQKQGKPNYMLMLTSNPDPGWVRTNILYATDHSNIHYYGADKAARDALFVSNGIKDPFVSTYVTATSANYHLPADFIAKNTAGKPEAWVKRYIEGSFEFAEGMVYPLAHKHIIPRFEIPKDWRRIISADFGRRDATAYLVGAIDPKDDVLYFYDSFHMYGGDTQEWIDGFRKLYNPIPASLWLYPPIGDPAGQSRGQADETSWYDLYAQHDIHFIPARTGKGTEMGISAGIALVNEYMAAGKIKFFDDLKELILELEDYKYKTASLMEDDGEIVQTEKPVGGKDHLMDCLRMTISMLPRDLSQKMSSVQSSYVPARSTVDRQDGDANNYTPWDAEFWAPPKADYDEYDPSYENDWDDPYSF